MNIQSIVSFVSRLSKRERTIFYATVFVISLVLLDRLVLSPILSKINELDTTIRSEEEAIKQSLLIVTQEDRIATESKQYVSYLSEPQGEEKELTAFLKEVENIAKKSSVYLVDIKPAGSNVDGIATRYFVKLNFEAQMEQVLHFFYSITNHEQLLKIEAYEISPKSEGGSVVTCSTSISKAIIPK